MKPELVALLKSAQRNEITESIIYARLAARSSGKNKKVLLQISKDEQRHYDSLKEKTGVDIKPNGFMIFWYLLLAKIFGIVFTLRIMEHGEDLAQSAYAKLKGLGGIPQIIKDEEEHEHQLISLLQEEKLDYAGSIVLGLNDALVELTGALAGLTFALQNAKLVALAGFITGFAASLSMAASGYLQGKEEAEQNELKSPLKAAAYTGIAYIITVFILIAPYLFLENIYHSLSVTLACAVMIVALYTFYISVAKRTPFWVKFLEMAIISLVVAALSFGVGWLLRAVFGIEI
jgi:VIT1/CCC1 family predicted Fe2+/Mn2+ transporter